MFIQLPPKICGRFAEFCGVSIFEVPHLKTLCANELDKSVERVEGFSYKLSHLYITILFLRILTFLILSSTSSTNSK
nr:MAG TPA: hypothetical protein [Caudoviricetes sp.]